MVHHIPEGYHSITPYLIIDGAARALEFYREAFGATEVMRMPDAEGKIMHAEMKIGDSHVMLADEQPEMGYRGPGSEGGTAVALMLYVSDVDETFRKAVGLGASEKRAVEDQFYGDRSGTLIDPFGHIWTIATHVEDVAPDEMERRANEWAAKQGS